MTTASLGRYVADIDRDHEDAGGSGAAGYWEGERGLVEVLAVGG
jgi:hypothetical protein